MQSPNQLQSNKVFKKWGHTPGLLSEQVKSQINPQNTVTSTKIMTNEIL